MKNIIIIIATVLISVNSYSQIKLTNKLRSNLKIVKLNDSNFKYYNFISKTNTIQLFNLDKTLWKTVSVNIPKDVFLDEILHISSDKLNQNPDIEIVFTTFNESYSDVFEDSESITYDNYNLIIVNEAGKELFKVKGGKTFKIITDEIKGKTILVDVYDNSEFLPERKTYAYSGFSF